LFIIVNFNIIPLFNFNLNIMYYLQLQHCSFNVKVEKEVNPWHKDKTIQVPSKKMLALHWKKIKRPGVESTHWWRHDSQVLLTVLLFLMKSFSLYLYWCFVQIYIYIYIYILLSLFLLYCCF
jgi:hypothetical protein